MGKKRASLTTGSMSSSIEKSKKAKKRRRESAPGSAAGGLVESSTSGGQEKEKRRSHKSSSSSSTEVVLRCASKDDVSPIVISFANQTVPHDMSALKFAVHSGEDEARRGQRVVMGEGPRMDYWGLNFGPGSESLDLCRFLVGVEDVESGEMTLHEAGHAYALRQSVGGRQDNVEDHAMDNLEWKQRRDALVNQFGSKKKKAAIRSRDANVIQAEAVVGGSALSRVLGQTLKEVDGADATAGGAGGSDGAATAVDIARRRFLPPMRPDASTPEGVYCASDIAGEQELQLMGRQVDRWAEACEGGLQQWVHQFAERPRDDCPKFVSNRLTLLLDLGEAKQKTRLLQLLYLRHMCAFHRTPNVLKGTPSQLATKHDIPEVILRKLLEKFTVCESRERGGLGTYVRTKTLKNQLVVHALCLALVLEGCRMEFEVLALDLRLSVAETRAMLRELGCTASNSTAQLKLPLVFPRSRKAKRKS
eukprot:jgi/Undpi1/9937/HiC_scaffold_28.g12391.m1